MSDQSQPWRVTTTGVFAAEVAAGPQGQRILAFTLPTGDVQRYVFTVDNAQTIGRQMLAPGVKVPNFPPEQ